MKRLPIALVLCVPLFASGAVTLTEPQSQSLRSAFVEESMARKDLEIAQLRAQIAYGEWQRKAAASQAAFEKVCADLGLDPGAYQPTTDLRKLEPKEASK